jgi:hypothetical protein
MYLVLKKRIRSAHVDTEEVIFEKGRDALHATAHVRFGRRDWGDEDSNQVEELRKYLYVRIVRHRDIRASPHAFLIRRRRAPCNQTLKDFGVLEEVVFDEWKKSRGRSTRYL